MLSAGSNGGPVFASKAWLLLSLLLTVELVPSCHGWGNSNGDEDTALFGNSLSRDWLYDSASIQLQVEGCMWGYVEDNENSGCMENGSEDGTTYWYQMANCRRAQVVFSLYASSSSSGSCSSSNFKESFVTRNGLSEFIYYMSTYDDNYCSNDDDNCNDDFDDLPMCEQSNSGYIGLGCTSDGTFALQYFSDAYCLQPTGYTYDSLSSLNNALKAYKSCANIYYNDGSAGDGSTLPEMLAYNSDSCSSLDSELCMDNESMKDRRSNTGSNTFARSRANFSSATRTWMTKLKYVAGGLLLLSSFVMFTGILFTNRRRRRALMQRKYRQSRSRDDRSRRSKSTRRSKSSGKRRDSSRTRRSSRSRSRSERPNSSHQNGGVLT